MVGPARAALRHQWVLADVVRERVSVEKGVAEEEEAGIAVEHLLAGREVELVVPGDDLAYRVEAIRDLLQSGIVADALIEWRAAHHIS